MPPWAVSIHAPRVGRDSSSGLGYFCSRGFNPRAPRGARHLLAVNCPSVRLFQSTRPAWGATTDEMDVAKSEDVSIHAPRVGRDPVNPVSTEVRTVSIHAPRVGRDTRGTYISTSGISFNPRAPRGARPPPSVGLLKYISFQSTRPAWGATRVTLTRSKDSRSFNPRAPRGARRHRLQATPCTLDRVPQMRSTLQFRAVDGGVLEYWDASCSLSIIWVIREGREKLVFAWGSRSRTGDANC